MIFSKGKKDYSKYQFFQNNSQIEIVERYNYLDIVFYFNGNLKHVADDLYNKALKAFFSVKGKFNNFQEVPLKICLKLFDSLLKPILTYGSEIWLSDYNINLNNFDNLPIEKLQHKMFKCIPGVKRQSSNMASRLECNRSPMLIFSLCLMYNYYMRLVKINRDRILYSAFTTDQDLAQENSKCWFSTLNKISKILKLDIKDLADNSIFRNNLIEYYHQQSDSQLQKNKSGAVDSKLILLSNIFIPNFVPFYLETNLSKSIKVKLHNYVPVFIV